MQPTGYLTQAGLEFQTVVLSKLLARDNGYRKLLTKLTLTYHPKKGPPEIAKMYKISDREGVPWIRLPRALVATLGRIVPIEVTLPPQPMHTVAQLRVDLFENQVLCVDTLMRIFTPERMVLGTACAELDLRAGQGKTFVAAGVISRLRCGDYGMRTLYIVPKQVLMKQAIDDLRGCFCGGEDVLAQNLEPVIGPFGHVKKKDPRTVVESQDITVCVIDSAMNQPPEFFARYGLVIFDEVHTYCSKQRRKIFEKAHCAVALAMTATPNERADGFDPIAQKEFICAGDGLIEAKDLPGFIVDEVPFRSRVTVIRYYGPDEYTKNLTHEATGGIFTPYMHKQFLADPYRTYIAVQAVKALYDWRGPNMQQHCIYVFCEELELLQILYRAFAGSFEVDAPEIATKERDGAVGNFVGGINDKVVDRLRESARILLTTYGYGGTGVSINKMTAIVKLTPRKAQMKQIDARILRRAGDISIERRIIDIQDYRTCLRYQLTQRMNSYEHYGMTVEVKKVHYTELALQQEEPGEDGMWV